MRNLLNNDVVHNQNSAYRALSTRRDMMGVMAAAATMFAGSSLWAAEPRNVSTSNSLTPDSAILREFIIALSKAPRRRSYKTVPMILNDEEQWDHEALDLIMSYKGTEKQAFDNTELDGPWLNLMRNSMNVQVFSWKHPDFLCVSATHGTAHLALYDDYIWEKYRFAELTKGKFQSNTLAEFPSTLNEVNANDVQNPNGYYSPSANSIPVLQERGAVFIACHNQVWEITASRIKAAVNPDRLSHEGMAAEFTNHLIPDVVLSPGAIGTLPELQRRGFSYAK